MDLLLPRGGHRAYSESGVYRRLLADSWPPGVAAALLGVLAAYYFGLFGTVWAVTGEFTRWGGHALRWFGVDPAGWGYFRIIGLQGAPWDRVDGWVVLGMFLGALASALAAGNVKWRVPPLRRRLVQGFVGGAVAGFGARLAMGCNLAAFFTGIPQFSLHTWLFMLGMGAGTYLGLKVALHPVLAGRPRLASGGEVAGAPALGGRSRVQPVLAAGVLALTVGLAAFYLLTGRPGLGLAALFGAAFGLIIERGQVCFTSAFRDLWLSGRSTMIKALFLGIAASTVGTAVFIHLGVRPKILWAGPGALVGGLLFGAGIVVAGGCETGWMYRAMEGQVHFWVVGAGNIAGATLLAWAWDHLHLYDLLVAPWPRVNLVEAWGWAGALLGTSALLAGSYAFAAWWERRHRYRYPAAAESGTGGGRAALEGGVSA